MNSHMPFRGVSSVPLARICRAVFDAERLEGRGAWEAAVRTLWDDAEYREERYAALALAGHRYYRDLQDPSTLGLYLHLIRTGAWWDLVDPVAAHRVGGILRAHHDEVAPVVRSWARDDDLWVRRTAILAQLGSKAGTDTELLRFVLESNLEDSLHGRQFFIRKALGWALREHTKTDPDWVRAFVAEHEERLSGLTRREASKHVR